MADEFPSIRRERRVYRVDHMVSPAGTERFVCPICGPLEGAVLKGHGPEHFIEDASQ